MEEIWVFLSEPSNQRTLGFLGTAVAVVIGAAWAVFTYLYPRRGVGANEIDVTADLYSAMVQKAEEQVKERFEERLRAAHENVALANEAKELYQREIDLLKTLLDDREESLTGLKKTLSEASATLAASMEGFSRSEIDTANKQIKNGNVGEATKLLCRVANKAESEASEAEFLLGKLAESEADLEKAAHHFRRAVMINSGKKEYRDHENSLYNITIVFESEMNEKAKSIASTLSEIGFSVRTKHWMDYKEDGDGAMSEWIRGPAYLYGAPTDRSKVMEIDQVLASAGIEIETDYICRGLRRRGTTWGFGGLEVSLWLPGQHWI